MVFSLRMDTSELNKKVFKNYATHLALHIIMLYGIYGVSCSLRSDLYIHRKSLNYNMFIINRYR